MRNFMEAYLAVYNTEAKEKLNSDRDPISEMNLSSLDDSDLEDIVESILQEMFQTGYSVESAQTIFNGMFVESNIVGRQKKIERLNETFNKVFRNIKSKASSIALEEFAKYRNNKKLQESWSARFNQEKRIQRTHNQLIAQESLNVKNLILQLVEKTGKSRLMTDKENEAANKRAREDMKKMGSMKNPHFGDGPTGSMSSEEVSNIRKGWGDAYTSIYEKRADKDYDGDGDIESGTDEYMGSRDKAIKKAMGKKKDKDKEEVEEGFDQMFDSLIEEGYTKSEALQIMTQIALDEDSRRQEEVEQYVDFLIDEGYDCSDLTWEDMFEEYESLDEGLRSAVQRLLGKKYAPVEKKPESRGEQLRKKYNIGPERSDTSAKSQILDRTRARAERDQKQYGGSVYTKSVADKSKEAYDRYLKAGYSKYGADDARGSGKKARDRAEALRNK